MRTNKMGGLNSMDIPYDRPPSTSKWSTKCGYHSSVASRTGLIWSLSVLNSIVQSGEGPYSVPRKQAFFHSAMKSCGARKGRLQWVPTHASSYLWYLPNSLVQAIPIDDGIDRHLRWLEPLPSNLLAAMYGPTTHTRSLRTLDMDAVISGSPTTNFQGTASATNKHKPYSDVN